MIRRTLLRSLFAAAVFAGAAWGLTPAQADSDNFIVVQSTTSTQNSGLLDYLLPMFTEKTGIEVRVVAVGTGQAITNASNGDGDVLLVHAKAAEEAFVAAGNGVARFDLMYNDFVIVGPASDPAAIAGTSDPVAAFQAIASSESTFASRGDDSGTNKAELNLWKATGIDPSSASGDWYRETGSGMGATLNTASGMNAYSMTDRGTWLKFANKGTLKILVEGDKRLFNPYGVMLVNPAKHPHIKADAGGKFVNWLISPTGQAAIAAYRLKGQQAFFPNASSGS